MTLKLGKESILKYHKKLRYFLDNLSDFTIIIKNFTCIKVGLFMIAEKYEYIKDQSE